MKQKTAFLSKEWTWMCDLRKHEKQNTQIFSNYFFVDKFGYHTTPIRVNSTMASWNGNIFRVTGLLWGEFTGHQWIPLTRPVTGSFDVFFDLCLNKRLSKQLRRRCFETPLHPTWRHCNGKKMILPPVNAIVRADIPLQNYSTQFIIGRVSTAPQIAKASTRHREQ